jgi:hypothetical protein
MMFGVATPEGTLSARGGGLAYTLVVAVGMGLALVMGLVILAVLQVVAHIPGIDLSILSMVNGSSFISTVEMVFTTLTTVGLSFGLLGKKAWPRFRPSSGRPSSPSQRCRASDDT